MKKRNFKKTIITGISGSGGSYLAEYIIYNHPEVKVHGISRWHSTSDNGNLKNIKDKITVHECDLCDLGSVISVINKVKPDCIFHRSHKDCGSG